MTCHPPASRIIKPNNIFMYTMSTSRAHSKPYDYAVANQLLWAANTIPGAIFAQLAFVTDDLFSNMREDVVVVRAYLSYKAVMSGHGKSCAYEYVRPLAASLGMMKISRFCFLLPWNSSRSVSHVALRPSTTHVWLPSDSSGFTSREGSSTLR